MYPEVLNSIKTYSHYTEILLYLQRYFCEIRGRRPRTTLFLGAHSDSTVYTIFRATDTNGVTPESKTCKGYRLERQSVLSTRLIDRWKIPSSVPNYLLPPHQLNCSMIETSCCMVDNLRMSSQYELCSRSLRIHKLLRQFVHE